MTGAAETSADTGWFPDPARRMPARGRRAVVELRTPACFFFYYYSYFFGLVFSSTLVLFAVEAVALTSACWGERFRLCTRR